jgi:hypothetical protein
MADKRKCPKNVGMPRNGRQQLGIRGLGGAKPSFRFMSLRGREQPGGIVPLGHAEIISCRAWQPNI